MCYLVHRHHKAIFIYNTLLSELVYYHILSFPIFDNVLFAVLISKHLRFLRLNHLLIDKLRLSRLIYEVLLSKLVFEYLHFFSSFFIHNELVTVLIFKDSLIVLHWIAWQIYAFAFFVEVEGLTVFIGLYYLSLAAVVQNVGVASLVHEEFWHFGSSLLWNRHFSTARVYIESLAVLVHFHLLTFTVFIDHKILDFLDEFCLSGDIGHFFFAQYDVLSRGIFDKEFPLFVLENLYFLPVFEYEFLSDFLRDHFWVHFQFISDLLGDYDLLAGFIHENRVALRVHHSVSFGVYFDCHSLRNRVFL